MLNCGVPFFNSLLNDGPRAAAAAPVFLLLFDDLSKCEIDKPRKRGVLTHTAGPIADGA